MKKPLYNQKGEKRGEMELPEKIFTIPLKPSLVHQVVLYYENLSRPPVAKTKDRGEVRGGGRKPWRQKGTGRARHGSIRSPIWRGGGTTFGPTPEKIYQIKIPKKIKKKALFMILSQKLRDEEIIFIDQIKIPGPKTKEIVEILKNLTKIKKGIDKKSVLLSLAERDQNILKAVKNVKKVALVGPQSLNPYILLKNKYIVIEKDAIEQIRNIKEKS